jgi:hypothetical protein
MFGGDTQQPGFVEAVKRVGTSAEPVLAAGTARVGVHGDRFSTAAGPLPDDDSYRRLALACYERRVEEMALTAAPTTTDLVSLYIVLTTAPEEIEDLGGARQMLISQGVQSIRLNEAVVSPTSLPDDSEGLSEEKDALSVGLGRLDDISQEFMLDRRRADANSVYRLLREVVAALPHDKANDLDTYKRLREALEKLPDEVRTSLSTMLIADVADEDVAEKIIGTMTDTSLARMLVDVSRETGSNPIDLARELVVGGFRRHDLVDLAAAAVTESLPGVKGGEAVEPMGRDRSTLLEAVGEIVTGELHEFAHEDGRSIRAEFPSTESELTEEALTTFADYLRVDDDVDRLNSVLESWARATRSALIEDRAVFAVRLIRVADHAYETMKLEHPERAEVIAGAKATILNQDLIADLMEQGSQEEISALIAMFGDVAVDALLQRLAAEEVAARRSLLIGVIINIIPGHRSTLRRWMNDKRWFVVRNLMTIVLRSGSSRKMLDVIEAGMRHPHHAVRKEAARALGPAGAEALPRLLILASDPEREVALAAADVLGSVALGAAKGDVATIGEVVRTASDDEVRERALELLSAHPSDEATRVLASLSRFGPKPRAPWAIRRKAKKLARQRRRPQG